jgi:hypothetical protein
MGGRGLIGLQGAALAALIVCGAGCAGEATVTTRAPTSAFNTSPLAVDFDPILVDPVVPAEDVHDAADAFVAASGEELLRYVRELTGPEGASDASRLLGPVPKGSAALSRLWFSRTKKVAFVLRTVGQAKAFVVNRGEGDALVPPIAWMSAALTVEGVRPNEVNAWYREMARRVATNGRATGIALAPNSNAIAIIVAVQPVPGDDADVQLVARTRFMHAGTFSAGMWGPALRGVTNVGTRKLNGHAGVSVRDILRGQGILPPPDVEIPGTLL